MATLLANGAGARRRLGYGTGCPVNRFLPRRRCDVGGICRLRGRRPFDDSVKRRDLGPGQRAWSGVACDRRHDGNRGRGGRGNLRYGRNARRFGLPAEPCELDGVRDELEEGVVREVRPFGVRRGNGPDRSRFACRLPCGCWCSRCRAGRSRSGPAHGRRPDPGRDLPGDGGWHGSAGNRRIRRLDRAFACIALRRLVLLGADFPDLAVRRAREAHIGRQKEISLPGRMSKAAFPDAGTGHIRTVLVLP